MSELTLASLLPTLDLVVFERLPNSVFMQVTPSPDWFVQTFGAASEGEAITLVQAFPYLDSFLTEAEDHWREADRPARRSEPFIVSEGGRELLIRAVAVRTGTRCLLVLERLAGAADPREILQKARDKDLDRERFLTRLDQLRGSARELSQLTAKLLTTSLTPEQREITEAAGRIGERFEAFMQSEHPHRVAAERIGYLSKPPAFRTSEFSVVSGFGWISP